MDSVRGPWTMSSLGPRWTGHGQRHRAHPPATPEHEGAGQGVGEGEGSRAAVKLSGDGGEGGGEESSGAGSLGAQKWGKEERGRSGGRRGCWGCPFIGLEEGRGGRAMEGNGRRRWCAMMVVETVVSGGDRPGWWWGVMRGCCSRFRSGRRGAGGGAHTHTHTRQRWWRRPFGPGRKTTGRGPRVGERGRGRLAKG
jgi:hypothetical protein